MLSDPFFLSFLTHLQQTSEPEPCCSENQALKPRNKGAFDLQLDKIEMKAKSKQGWTLHRNTTSFIHPEREVYPGSGHIGSGIYPRNAGCETE